MEAKLAFEARQRRREHVARSRLIAVSAAPPDTVLMYRGAAAVPTTAVPTAAVPTTAPDPHLMAKSASDSTYRKIMDFAIKKK